MSSCIRNKCAFWHVEEDFMGRVWKHISRVKDRIEISLQSLHVFI